MLGALRLARSIRLHFWNFALLQDVAAAETGFAEHLARRRGVRRDCYGADQGCARHCYTPAYEQLTAGMRHSARRVLQLGICYGETHTRPREATARGGRRTSEDDTFA